MRFAGFLLFACCILQADSVTSEAEKQVHERADQFYSLLISGKFREAEEFVAPEDKDTYYNMEKPSIKSYKLTGLSIGKDKTKADVNVSGSTSIRRPMVGEMEIPLSFVSHWKLVNGNWFWFIPQEDVRQTPFGPMHFNKSDLNSNKQVDLKRMIAQGPTPETLMSAVKADKTNLSVGPGQGTAVVRFQNTLSGPVDLSFVQAANTAFKLTLRPEKIPGYASGILVITRVHPSGKDAEQIVVKVEPTHQLIPIQVR